jgi:hypothetical protein
MLVLLALSAAKCGDELDCSLNGQCVAGTCVCNPAWEGADCGRLVLLPAGAPAFGAGSGGNFSSWGGGVLQVEGSYHMFASVMANECGLNTWTTNSFIQHAVSNSPLGPFQLREVVRPIFSHNPTPIGTKASRCRWERSKGLDCRSNLGSNLSRWTVFRFARPQWSTGHLLPSSD